MGVCGFCTRTAVDEVKGRRGGKGPRDPCGGMVLEHLPMDGRSGVEDRGGKRELHVGSGNFIIRDYVDGSYSAGGTG